MIVDASALLFLVLPHGGARLDHERLRAVFRRILADEPLESPALVVYELGQAIHRRRPTEVGLTIEARKETLGRLLALTERRASGPDVLGLAGVLVEESRLSFYDATYVAHSQLARAPLVTADSGMFAHARAQGLDAYLLPDDVVRLEQDYPEKPSAA